MKYDYMYDGGRTRDSSGAKKLRLVCIFVVVAAITGFVIWKTMPSDAPRPLSPPGGGTPSSVTSPEKGQGGVPERDGSRGGSSVGAAGSPARGGEVSGEKEHGVGTPPDADPAGTASGPAADPQGRTGAAPGNTTPGGNDASVRRGAEAAAGYEKGRPGPQDPAPVNDKPLIPAEKSDAGDVDRRLKELTSALEKKDFAAVSSSAPEILSSLTPGSGPFRTALRILTEANWARVISRDVSGGFAVMHTVRAGEFLGRIVRKNKTNVSLVMLVNKLKKSDIMVGQKLVLLPGPWKITVSKKRRQLELWRNGVIFMGFDVGIGRFGSTPSALFVVSDRLKHPVYRTRDGRVFQHGESGNELGDYFLKLAAAGTPDRPLLGYGIHGTPDESSVMRSLSSGCIRMRNAEVEKLYHIVPAGTPVEIGD